MSRIPPRVLLFVAGATTLLFAASACSSGSDTPNSRDFTAVPPSSEAVSVGIVSTGEQVLNGWLFGGDNEPVVILSHMKPSDQTAWAPFAELLAENGYAALTYDFRGYGISPGNQDSDLLDEDLTAVVEYMKARGRQQIFLVGASMGGTASIVVAAQEDVKAAVAISAPSEFEGLRAADAIEGVSEPLLLLVAADDTAAVVSRDELLERAPASTPSETYPDGEHGTDLVNGLHSEDVQADILAFLEEHTN